jgi:YbgA-like uncharacterized protein
MRTDRDKVEREFRTIAAMITLYCREQHGCEGSLCPNCGALYAYAEQRLEKCPFGDSKPTCAKCTVHCYKPAYREQIRVVMRYAGPRMLLHRPILAIRHMLQERKPAPEPPSRNKKPAAEAR